MLLSPLCSILPLLPFKSHISAVAEALFSVGFSPYASEEDLCDGTALFHPFIEV